MTTHSKTCYDRTTSGPSYVDACEAMKKNLAAQFSERELPTWFTRLIMRFVRMRARCDGIDCKARLSAKPKDARVGPAKRSGLLPLAVSTTIKWRRFSQRACNRA